MFASELKNRIEEACYYHLAWNRASGEGMTLPPEMKVVVPYYKEDGTFYGYGAAYAYYDQGLNALVIEQMPEMILGQ
jgi:hypothetical protein